MNREIEFTRGYKVMLANQILDAKGREVATIAPDATVADVVAQLATRNVGALVVSSDGERLEGIISERDVVRALAAHGAGTLQQTVSELMAGDVATCDGHADTEAMMGIMTTGRFRHLPVVEDDRITGIISIGDVVKVRIDELATEREQLVGYIQHGR